MKRTLKIATLVLAAMLLFGSLFVQVQAADTAGKKTTEPDGLNIKVENGFGGEYKIGYYCPFTITIDNGYKDFSGEIQLRMPNDYITDTLYAIKADIPKGTKETFKVDLPVFNYATRVKLLLVEGKNTIYEKNLTIKPGISTDMLMLGVLSDSNETVGYFTSIYDASGMLQPMKIVRLDEKNFPESDLALRAFNGIIINDFDTAKLNSKQYDALKKSVNAGTGLLVGTGGFAAKTFGAFTDNFIPGKVGAVKKINTTGLSDIAKVQQPFPLNINVADISIKGAKVMSVKGGLKLIQELPTGKGDILVAAFDLGQKEIGNWNDRANFSSEILKKLFAYKLATMNTGNPQVGLATPYYLDNYLRNIPELPRPNFLMIMLILGIYIIVVAPGTYMILKKIDKRELMWFVAPALGIVFAGILFFAGSSTRLNEPIVNYVDIMETSSDGNSTLSTFASIFSPDRRDLIVTSDLKSKLIPMINANYDPSINTDDSSRKVFAKITLGEKTGIEYKENGVGSSRIVSIDGEQEIKGGIKCEINRAAGDFQGYITNQTGMELEGITIMFKNSFIRIDKLKDGEKRVIKEKQKKTYSDYWQMLNEIYPDPYSIKKSVSTMTPTEILKIRTDFQRRQMIEGYSQGVGFAGKAKVFAFGKKQIAAKIFINGKNPKNYEKVVVIGDAEVSYKKGSNVFIPTGVIMPQLKPTNINNGINLNPDAGFIYGNGGTAEIFYEIDKTTKVTELTLSSTNNPNAVNGKPMPPGPSTGNYKEFIWDYKTSKWIEAKPDEITYKGQDAERYLGASNILRIKYDALNGEAMVPQISVKGTVR